MCYKTLTYQMINMMRPRALYTDTALASFILVIQKFESRITDDPSWLKYLLASHSAKIL